jgi:IS30 family transposase
LFIQARGGLKRELTQHLRTRRANRRAQGKKPPSGKGQIVDPVMISERPAEVEDRAVPGHWEGDLVMGKRQTAIGTLVERWSRYVMLFTWLQAVGWAQLGNDPRLRSGSSAQPADA